MVNANFLFLQSVNYPLLKVNYLPTDIAWILSVLYIDLSVHADILLDWKCFYNILDTNFAQELLGVIGLQEERRGETGMEILEVHIAGNSKCFVYIVDQESSSLFVFGLASGLIVILDCHN
ncbi:hypothetical protein ACJX0J_010267, partial [Zea mays]